jgi:glycosyltransferase involved in cell wall biosynthesis
MGNFYILLRGYFPGLAANNHYLGWLKSFDALGVEATVVNIRPNDNFEQMPEIYHHLNIVNLWDNKFCRVKNRKLRFIIHRFNVWRFTNRVKAGDTVWIYDLPEAVIRLATKKDIHIYNEVTEHPEIGVAAGGSRKRVYRRINAIKHIESLFVISSKLKQAYIDRGVEKDKIHIINMTVDPSRFENLKKQGNEKSIVYCGNGANNKDGVDQLIKSFALVHNKYPGFRLTIIGPSPKRGDASGNIELVEQLGLQESVIFSGQKSPEEVPQLLKNATILALDRPDSLQAQNGFPTKLGEYLLTGNPVCVTNVGDIPLFLKDGESAIVAEHDNVEDFSSKLLWIIEHPQEAAIIGKRGQEVALEHFNPMKEAKKMLRVMKMI